MINMKLVHINNTTQKVFVSKATEIVNNLASNLNDNNDSAVDNNDASADNTNSSNTNNTNTKSSGVNMTIYNVDYIAFVNKNILSVVIKATLKEGNDSQRVIIQTYNYNLSSNQKVDFTDLLQMENIQVDTAESKIKENIEAQSEYSDSLNETGNSVYKRDSSNKMYGASQTENFYLDEEENLYAIYAYGNDNNTTEFDIIKINDSKGREKVT